MRGGAAILALIALQPSAAMGADDSWSVYEIAGNELVKLDDNVEYVGHTSGGYACYTKEEKTYYYGPSDKGLNTRPSTDIPCERQATGWDYGNGKNVDEKDAWDNPIGYQWNVTPGMQLWLETASSGEHYGFRRMYPELEIGGISNSTSDTHGFVLARQKTSATSYQAQSPSTGHVNNGIGVKLLSGMATLLLGAALLLRRERE